MFYYPTTLGGGVNLGHPEEGEHHLSIGSKAEWASFEDNLPRHEEGVGLVALIK